MCGAIRRKNSDYRRTETWRNEVEFKVCFHKWQGKAQGRRMIIELRNIHAKWKVLIGDTCMLRANRNETMWNGTGFGVYGHITDRWKTN